MKITGHKNRSVFDRYDIVDVEGVQQAMKRVERAALPTVSTTRRQLKGKKLVPHGRSSVGVSGLHLVGYRSGSSSVAER